METIQFKNCRIIREHKIIEEDLWVRNGIIIDPLKVFYHEKIKATTIVDCKNAIIAPGFIDLQINGGYGVDFSYDVDTVSEGVQQVAKKLLAHGVTSFCPTIVTSPSSVYHKVLPLIEKRNGSHLGAGILGVHLEGPFINLSKKGAHPKNCIVDFDNGIMSVENIYGSLKNVSIVTLAPEKKLANEVIQYLTKLGIVVALGHSMANLKEGELAAQHGACLITHLFNAMLPFHHRDPGLVGLLTSEKMLKDKVMYYGIISDDVHTHPAALRIAYRAHPKGMILVTDAISGLGLPEGKYHIGQLDMEVKNGKAFIAGTDTLCGSIAPMDECIRLFRQATNCSTAFALEAASLHPAMCLGINNSKGTLKYEADADFVFLDDNLKVISTWIAGECVFRQ